MKKQHRNKNPEQMVLVFNDILLSVKSPPPVYKAPLRVLTALVVGPRR